MFNRKFELLYKKPLTDDHMRLAEALDEIFLRLENIDSRLKSLENPEISSKWL